MLFVLPKSFWKKKKGGGDSPAGVFPKVPTLFVIKFYKKRKTTTLKKIEDIDFYLINFNKMVPNKC